MKGTEKSLTLLLKGKVDRFQHEASKFLSWPSSQTPFIELLSLSSSRLSFVEFVPISSNRPSPIELSPTSSSPIPSIASSTRLESSTLLPLNKRLFRLEYYCPSQLFGLNYCGVVLHYCPEVLVPTVFAQKFISLTSLRYPMMYLGIFFLLY